MYSWLEFPIPTHSVSGSSSSPIRLLNLCLVVLDSIFVTNFAIVESQLGYPWRHEAY